MNVLFPTALSSDDTMILNQFYCIVVDVTMMKCKGAAASRWVARLQSISEVFICSPIRATLTVIVMGTPSHYDVVITVIVIATMTTVWCGLFIYSIKRRRYLSLFIGWPLLVLLFCTRWYDIQKNDNVCWYTHCLWNSLTNPESSFVAGAENKSPFNWVVMWETPRRFGEGVSRWTSAPS